MNTIDEQDREIAATLRRAAVHLARRGSEYIEHPVMEQPGTSVRGTRGRRLLVGTSAAATLCVIALAGSFIGGTSSGKVDVAKAAWTPVPEIVTDSMRKDFAISCNSIVAEFWRSGVSKKLNPAPVPDSLKEPSLIDFRGTTKLGVYFGGDLVLVCLLFDGRGVMVQRLDGFGGAASAGQAGSLNAITLKADDRTIGLIFGDLPKDSGPAASVDIVQVGRSEVIKASVIPEASQYAAWSPSVGNVSVRFVSPTSTDIGSLGPKAFLSPCLGDCFGAPTTVPGTPTTVPGEGN